MNGYDHCVVGSTVKVPIYGDSRSDFEKDGAADQKKLVKLTVILQGERRSKEKLIVCSFLETLHFNLI